MTGLPDVQSSEAPTRAADSVLASRLHLRREAGGLRATYRWFAWKKLFIYLPGATLFLFFGLLLIGFVGRPASNPGQFLLVLLSALGMLLFGVGGIYLTATILINRTEFTIFPERLEAHHGPLPYPGNCSVPWRELKDIHTETTAKKGIPLFLPVEGGGGELTPKASFYLLSATLMDGRKLKLAYGADAELVGYLETIIAERTSLYNAGSAPAAEVVPVGLEMRPVAGGFSATYRWFGWRRMLLSGGMAVVCLLVMLSFAWIYLGETVSRGPLEISTQLAVFGCFIFALLGIYQCLATAFNRTTITVSRERIRVHHGPLPYPGDHSLVCARLEKLMVLEKGHNADSPALYELDALVNQGKVVKVWSHGSYELLSYLKQRMEQQLRSEGLPLRT